MEFLDKLTYWTSSIKILRHHVVVVVVDFCEAITLEDLQIYFVFHLIL